MKTVMLLFFSMCMMAAEAQAVLPPTYPFNPDSDGDEFVAVGDVLASIATFDNPTSVPAWMVSDTLTIEQALEVVLLKLDSLLDGNIGGGSNGNGGNGSVVDSTWTCGDPWNYWGFDYRTYAFENQCWFQDNLRTLQYDNGDSLVALSNDLPGEDLSLVTEGACFVSSYIENETLSLNAMGRMYNWYAVADARNLCPAGWHVPLQSDWVVLEDAIALGNFTQGELLWDATYFPTSGYAFTDDGFLFTPHGVFQSNTSSGSGGASYWTGSLAGGNTAIARDAYATGDYLSVNPFFADVYSATGVRCVKD